jgi:hypothetical protein
MKARIAHHLILDAESITEMRRQLLTTYLNISLWYDGWESFVLKKGMFFAVLFTLIVHTVINTKILSLFLQQDLRSKMRMALCILNPICCIG